MGPLSKGGTLKGDAAAGKAPSDATLGKSPALSATGKFQDSRWKDGNWDLAQFTTNGKTNWDAVIDAGELAVGQGRLCVICCAEC